MKQLVRLIIGLSLLTLGPLALLAQPANDMFASSWPLAGNVFSTNGNSSLPVVATKEPGEPNHAGFVGGRSVWFHWTAPATGVARLDTFGSGFNTLLGVYRGTSVSSLNQVAANDNAYDGTSASRVYFWATAGMRYEIAVDGRSNSGASGRSGPYNLNLQMLPYVSIVTPTNGTLASQGVAIALRADATSPNGTVTKVDFYHDATVFYTAFRTPYEASYADPPLGTNTFHAVVTDATSQLWTSAVVNVTVLQPGVAITTPTDGQSFLGTAPILLTATAASANGPVTNVQFHANGAPVAQDATPPFAALWTNVTPGAHTLTALQRDTTGATATSAPVHITVTGQSLVHTGSIWKYLDDGSNQGTAWTAPDFDHTAWLSGRAELGYGDAQDGRPETTVISYGSDPANKHITTYFRHPFTVAQPGAYTNLILRVLRDDGAIVHLNGHEVARYNMPTGPVDYLTTAPNATDDGTLFHAVNLAPNLLQPGTNLLAVEIHQQAPTSSDLSFDLELIGEIGGPLPPHVTLTTPADRSTFTPPADITLTAVATANQGAITNLQFLANDTPVGAGSQESGGGSNDYTLLWNSVPEGTYVLRAVAMDDSGLSATSAPVTITVTAQTSQPVTFIPAGSIWKYLDDGSNQGTAWTASDFNDTAWASGPAELGYGDLPEGRPEATVLCCSNAASKHLTYYFRHSFLVPQAGQVTNLTVRLLRDDGAAVYLNGQEILRHGLPEGALFDTPANNTAFGAEETTYFEFQMAPAWLRTGTNVLAVEVHQNGTTSSDLSFDLELIGDVVTAGNPAPVVAITSPTDGSVFQWPANLTLNATAVDFDGIARVEFFTNGVNVEPLAVPVSSFEFQVSSFEPAVGTYALRAVAEDTRGARATSSVVTITIDTPPVNTNPPVILTVNPPAGSIVGELTTIQITFSEPVVGVDAADLLVNGVPASGVTGSGANYTFAVSQPSYGTAQITWAPNHGIADLGLPVLPFDANGPNATWNYHVVDAIPPAILSVDPPRGALLTNLVQITVTFTEPVMGVDASDLLINGAPAIGLTPTGPLLPAPSSYTFSFSQPGAGTVNITWDTDHGITDLASVPNAFDALAAGATWQYLLDSRTILVPIDASYRYFKGREEPSAPMSAWREIAFDDSTWSNGLAPFFYDDDLGPPPNPPYTGNTELADMMTRYTCVYLRTPFYVESPDAVTNLALRVRSDDGYIAWINGVEVVRYRVPSGELPYNATAYNAPEPLAVITNALADPASFLVAGTNLLAIQAVNAGLSSSDLLNETELSAVLADASVVAPRLVSVSPAAGNVFHLTNITVTFSEPVGGVDAADLLINNVHATGVEPNGSPLPAPSSYTFSFAQPAYGTVAISWAADHGIVDFDVVPKPFDGSSPAATFQYTLLNPNAPVVAVQSPLPGATVNSLTEVSITFSKTVVGVDAADLLVNGVPATGFSGSGSTYRFTFPQPAYGPVTIGWAANHGIQDEEVPPNTFNSSRPGNTWTYTLIDQTPPAIASQMPLAGLSVTNLTEIQITFTEPVTGVDAADLLINGEPATTVAPNGSLLPAPSSYTFTFTQPNATVVNVSWAPDHEITDLASVPNAFDAGAPGSTWQYTTPDTVAPALAGVSPPAYATVRTLSQIVVTFTEAVTGLDAGDLLINSVPAHLLAGSGAGPYTFHFTQPANGPVEIRWAMEHGIRDLATPANPFAADEWTYILDPNASFADKIVINEIMFHPQSERVADEWIELHNTAAELVNLAGWQFIRGIDFRFPNVSIPAGGYLVVAADVATFQAKYPGVANVIGGWTGRLANSDERISLVTALGEQVDEVHYASEGNWAVRQAGRPAQRVARITRSGSTATVTISGHGFSGTDQVLITGADQAEYNGRFSISGIGVSTFNITVAGTPASPATGTIICRAVEDNGTSGWSWFSAADGFGSSLELMNPAMPNEAGQNWFASAVLEGTPGRANSMQVTNAAPLVLDVAHFPAVPRSTDAVTLTARVRDEWSEGVQAVTLYYRNHSSRTPPAFSSTSMVDDGLHNDGVAGDGIYGAILDSMPHGTVVEFYVEARDAENLLRTWPALALQTDNSYAQNANAVYQVDDEAEANTMPFLRLVMTETERYRLQVIDRNSDAEMNATLISQDGDGTKVRYNAGVRIRGAGSRSRTPPNYRVNIPTDRRWNGLNEINLNTQFIHAQLAGSALALRAGLPVADGRVVQVRVNGSNLAPAGTPSNGTGSGAGFGSYILIEPLNGDWANNRFPQDAEGNVYRASTGGHNANFSYGGTNAEYYLNRGYSKTSNQSDNDWSDLGNLTWALNNVAADGDYVEAVRTNLNAELWMRFWAVGTFLGYGETSLFNGIGDDYAMYRGVHDPRFVLVGHDFDTVLGQGDTTTYLPTRTDAPIWIMINPPNPAANVTALRRFVQHPEFAPVYYGELLRLAEGALSAEELEPLLDQILGGWVPAGTIQAMKNYAAARRANVLSQIPQALTVSHDLPVVNGYFRATSPNVTLYGTAHAAATRRVRVDGSLATWSAREARWTNLMSLNPGLNELLVHSFDGSDVELERTTVRVWYDTGTARNISGTIGSDTAWTAANGPYHVTGNVSVPAGVTLTIQAGTTVYFTNGAGITVNGRLLAEGTESLPIFFMRPPGQTGNWSEVYFQNTTTESRLAHVYFGNGGSSGRTLHANNAIVWFDHLTFLTADRQYLSLDNSSFMVSDCFFPTASAAFELVHGSGGIRSGGRGIFLRNFFGAAQGYNDVVDFTGGNRPNQPILQFINNVFAGSGDDHLDLDGTDAWIEGNIFLHAHQNGSPDTASAISGGANGSDRSEITVLGNIIYDCDQAAMAKEGNFYTLINNTIVRQTHQGGTDTEGAVVCLADEGTAQAAGIYLEGNIIYDAEQPVRNHTTALVTFTNNLMPAAWSSAPFNFEPGASNAFADPLFHHVPQLAETAFTNWQQAQILREWFSLRTGSPGRGTGPNGRDKGGVIPLGASLSAVPESNSELGTPNSELILTVGVNRTGNGVPTTGFPNGSGFTHYKWRLDANAWSAETPITTPITLTGLANGPHSVEVIGRNDAGWYQNDAALGADAVVTRSATWTVNTAAPALRLNEVLASNDSAVNHHGTSPDVIELYNAGSSTLDLGGVRLTDDPSDPDQFVFPDGTTLAAGAYLVVFANDPDGTPGHHLGFNLGQGGDAIYLYDSVGRGGALLDSVTFGAQLTDLSIGRVDNSDVRRPTSELEWALTVPTFGAANQPAPTANSNLGTRNSKLLINEWLAVGESLFSEDFVELYNGDPLPVSLGGLYLTDEPMGWPDRHPIAPLTFIGGYGYLRFVADGDAQEGPDHLGFRLNPDQGMIALNLPDLTTVDFVSYQAQWPDVSQGRSPNGSSTVVFFDQPTPGAPNPYLAQGPQPLAINVIHWNHAWRYEESGTDLGTAWREPAHDDSAWTAGAGLLAREDCGCLPEATNTVLTLGRPTYYFRTHFTHDTIHPVARLELQTVLDDGAVFYLNGVEVYRLGMNGAAGSAVSFTDASGRVIGNAGYEGPFSIPFAELRPGDNVFAVEVHQQDVSSSDVVFGMKLDVLVITNSAPGDSVVINEVLANNASFREPEGGAPDWVELYNQSPTEVDLSDLSLTDDTIQPRRWVFPSGTRIPAGGYLRIVCDGDQPASTNNTGFGLKASGDAVYLFDAPANGGSLLDAVPFGIQAADFSIARIPNGTGTWELAIPTAESANIAATLGNAARLKLNEWMAAPSSGDDWFEVFNPEPQPVAVGGLFLTDDLSNRTKHRIAPLSFLGASTNGYQKFVADGNTGAGADHVSFSLKASGEALGLAGTNGILIDAIAFGAQESGVPEGRFPDGADTIVRFAGTESPGASNFRLLTEVVIHEVLTHTDPPFEDAIELHNVTAQDIDLSGWWLSDDKATIQKYQIPLGTSLPAHGYAVFYESAFSNRTYAAMPFSLSSKGDEVTLSAVKNNVLTGYRTSVKFGAAENAVSFGRYLNSVGEEQFVAMSSRTFGQDDPGTVEQFRLGTGLPNAYPKVGPIVISEIMYHPPDAGTNDNVLDEFVELHNITSATVSLYDAVHPTNVWRLRDAVDFDFAPFTTIPADGYLVVVSFDPVGDPLALAAFRSRYGLGPEVRIVGPYSGKLANSSDSVELKKPDVPDLNDVPYVLVDRVNYADAPPWDAGADGTGLALQRVADVEFGNDPANWIAVEPTPGTGAGTPAHQDSDNDGMPDVWEIAHGFNENSPFDANLDADGDGRSNLDEFRSGTDPRSAASVLRFDAITPLPSETDVGLAFVAISNVTYSVEYTEQLGLQGWTLLYNLDAAPTNRLVQLPAAATAPQRFYRIRTPRLP